MVEWYGFVYGQSFFGRRKSFALYRYCTGSAEGGPGVHQGGPPARGGHMGCGGCALAYMGQGHQPQEAHAPRDRKKGRVLKGEGTSEVPWGGWTPSPPWPHPSLEEGARLRPPPLPWPYI